MDHTHINVEDLTDEGVELYAGVLLLNDLITQANLPETFLIRCKNLRNHWIGLLMTD